MPLHITDKNLFRRRRKDTETV